MIGSIKPIANPNPTVAISGIVTVTESTPITINGPAKTLLFSQTNQVLTISTNFLVNTSGMHRIAIYIFVSAISGTGPSLNPIVDVEDITHTIFYAVTAFPSFTGAGSSYFMQFGPDMPLVPGQANPPTFASNLANFPIIITDTIRLRMSMAGTTPSVTYSLSVYGETI